jgi:hypothetical protein
MYLLLSLRSRDSSVSIEAGYDLRTRYAIPGRGKIPTLEPNQLLVQWLPGTLPTEVK